MSHSFDRYVRTGEEFEDTKGVIRIRISKNRQHNGQKKKYKQRSTKHTHDDMVYSLHHRRLCRVKNMLAMYLKYHKAGLTPTTPVTSIAISPVKMSIGRKSHTNLRSDMIFHQGKPVFFISSYHLYPHTDR